MGSGATLFECENLNRKYIGFDINDKINSSMKDNLSFGDNKRGR